MPDAVSEKPKSAVHIRKGGRRTACYLAALSAREQRGLIAGATLVVLGTGVDLACLSPTQVDLRVTTDIDCPTVSRFGYSIAGDDGNAPVTSAHNCDGADRDTKALGNLIVTPSGANDAVVTVAVALGVTRPSETCAAARYQGCIVSRRRVRYTAHKTATLPIFLSRACLDVPCDDTTSCAAGRCVPSAIDDSAFCTGTDCPWSRGAVTSTTTSCAGGPCVVTRIRDGAATFGITAFADTLFWAEDAGVFTMSVADVVYPARTPKLVGFLQPAPRPRGVSALAFRGRGTLMATVGAPANCIVGREIGDENYYQAPCTGDPLGIATFDNAKRTVPDYVLSFPLRGIVQPTGANVDLSIDRPGYMEGADGGVYIARRSGISFLGDLSNNSFAVSDAGAVPNEDVLGLALGESATYLSTTAGHLLKRDRSSGAIVALAPDGAVPSPQDLVLVAHRPPPGADLYIAAGDGLYVVRNVE